MCQLASRCMHLKCFSNHTCGGEVDGIQELSLSVTSVGVFEAPVEKTLGCFLTNFIYNYTFLMVVWDLVSGRSISESVGETC